MPANCHNGSNVFQFRPHHICCVQFWMLTFEERGSDFLRVLDKLKSVLLLQPETKVIAIEGVDELCQQCPFHADERCNSPWGNEEEVRKWDAILLKELGLPFGTCLNASEWQMLIEQKIPFKLCQKCQWKQECNVEAKLP